MRKIICFMMQRIGLLTAFMALGMFLVSSIQVRATVVPAQPENGDKVVPAVTEADSPQRVKATVTEKLQVKLEWTKDKAAVEYRVYRSTKYKTGYQKIGTCKKNQYTDKKVKNGVKYYYKIVPVISENPFIIGDEREVVEVGMPLSPPLVSGYYIKKKLKLSWEKVKGAKRYHIYKKNSGGVFEKIGSTDNLYYQDKEVKKGKTYQYKVTAVYMCGVQEVESVVKKPFEIVAEGVDPNKKMVALTFDDGPGPYTMPIVKCLKENNAKATFFVVGSRIDTYKKELKAEAQAGCEIANHSYSHPNLTRLSGKDIQSQVSRTDQKIKSVTGKVPTIIRTPGGATNSAVKENVGKPIILWSIDTLDWKTRNRDKTVNAVLNNVKDGDIVLMHDIHQPTKNAALIIIPRLRSMGYQLVTVSELAMYRGYKMKNGTIYYNLRKSKKK